MRIHFHTQKEKKNKNYLRLKKEKKKKERKKYNGYTVYFVIIVFRNNIIVTPCKGFRIPESGKFLLVETGILENFVKESGVPGRRKTQKTCKVEPKFKSKPRYPFFHLSACTPESTCTMCFDVSFIIFSGIFYQARHIQSAT